MSCSTRRSRCTEAFVPRSSRSADGVLIDDFGVLDLMVRLVEKSLVHLEADGTEACYRLLETIRYYAQVRLASGTSRSSWRLRRRLRRSSRLEAPRAARPA
jgi:predicted ATPase